MPDALDEIARSRTVSITTFRRDGRAVPTPVWFAVDGGELFTMSRSDAGKVKRIRNGGRVLLAPCDGRGRIPPGAPTAEGTARLLDEAGTRRVHALMVRRYLAVRLVDRWRRLVRRPNPSIGIAVTLAPAAG